VRDTTDSIEALVGDPMEVSTNVGERSLTMTGMAQEMAQSVEFGLGYARAVARIGPMGLDLVFVFVGLAWLLIVNVLTLLIRLIAWFIRAAGKALEFVWRLLLLLISVIRLIVAVLDLFLPF
jgi:hypothetical protein